MGTRTSNWYIETQRYGEEAILGGLIKNDPEAIAAGFKMNVFLSETTGGQERRRTGEVKRVDPRIFYRGFAYWASATDDSRWSAIARRIAQFYYN